MEIPQFIWWLVGVALVLGILLTLGVVFCLYVFAKATVEAAKEHNQALPRKRVNLKTPKASS